jgi:hypothetical protein
LSINGRACADFSPLTTCSDRPAAERALRAAVSISLSPGAIEAGDDGAVQKAVARYPPIETANLDYRSTIASWWRAWLGGCSMCVTI